MIEMIAERVKSTRDQYFITEAQNASGATVTVNRCEAIGQLGGESWITRNAILPSRWRGL